MPPPETPSILLLAAWDPRCKASGRPPNKTPPPLLWHVDLLLQKCVTAPLHNNDRGANYRKHHSSIVARVRWRGNVLLSRCLAIDYSGYQASSHYNISGIIIKYTRHAITLSVRPQVSHCRNVVSVLGQSLWNLWRQAGNILQFYPANYLCTNAPYAFTTTHVQ